MEIKVNKITDMQVIKDIVKHCWGKEATASLDKWYKSGHSPIYTQQFIIFCKAPKGVFDQLRTHEKLGCQFYCDSGRPDIGNNQKGNSRDATRSFVIWCNAEHLKNMAMKRLCYKAELPTWEFACLLREEIRKVDSALAEVMLPKCNVFAECNEFKKCEGFRQVPDGCVNVTPFRGKEKVMPEKEESKITVNKGQVFDYNGSPHIFRRFDSCCGQISVQITRISDGRTLYPLPHDHGFKRYTFVG